MAVFRNHDTINEIIMQEVKIRKSLKWTQGELAKRMGTTQSNISKFESGKYNPTLEFLNKMAKALGKQLHATFE